MNITDTRRANLAHWVKENGIPQKEKSLFSQLRGGGSFGEKVARRLESDYRMGDGYLDRPSKQENQTAVIVETGRTGKTDGSTKIIGLPKTHTPVSAEVLAAIGFLTDREAYVISQFRMCTEGSKELIEIGLKTMEKLPLSPVADDQLKDGSLNSWSSGSNGN